MKAVVFVLVCLLFIVSPAALASETDVAMDAQAEAAGVPELEEALPQAAEDALGEFTVMDGLNVNESMEKLLAFVTEKLQEVMRSTLSASVSVIAAVMLCSVVSSFYPGATGSANLVCVLAIAAVVLGDSASMSASVSDVLDEIDAFSKMLLPTLTAAATAGGAVTSAAAKYAVSAFFMDVLITVGRNVVLPIIYAYMAASVASAAFGSSGITGACAFLKWAAVSLLTVMVTAFTVFLSITGVVSGTVDAASLKAAKMTISGVLPVVGGMISDAANAILAGAGMLRSAVGVFGLIVVAAVIAVPFMKLGVSYLLYKAAGSVAAAVAEPGPGRLISNLTTAMGMMLGLVGASGMVLFISIVSVMKAVV